MDARACGGSNYEFHLPNAFPLRKTTVAPTTCPMHVRSLYANNKEISTKRKNKYDGEGEREREKGKKEEREKESFRRIEIGFAKSFPVFAKCLVHDKWRLWWRPDSCEYRIKHVTNRIQFGEQDVRKLYKLRHHLHRGENPGGPTRTSRKLSKSRIDVSLGPFSRESHQNRSGEIV